MHRTCGEEAFIHTIRVGAVACPAIVGITDKNLEQMRYWIQAAREQKVELLLFPELNLSGYATNGCLPQALHDHSPEVSIIREMARASAMTLAVGLVWQEAPGAPPYLAHGLWLPSGERYLYFKTHLGEREAPHYAAGSHLPVFALPRVRVGLQLCLEQHFPEITQTLALRGAQLVLCPHATPRLTAAQRRESWHISLRARAYDNCVFVLACNQVGENGRGATYHGGLLLVDPTGAVIAEDFSGKPGMIWADIQLDLISRSHATPEKVCRRFFAPKRRKELYD